MFEIHLSRSKKIRLWQDRVPEDFVFEATSHVVQSLSSNATSSANLKLGFEVFIPRGPRFDYGLVGGILTPEGENELMVDIGAAVGNKPSELDTIVGPLDKVWVGLIPEYAQAVYEGMVFAQHYGALIPSGRLRIFYGGYGEVGSSVFCFRMLGNAFIRLLGTTETPKSTEDWQDFLERVGRESLSKAQ